MDQPLKTSFEAVVVRYVHDVVADERLNICIVLVCPERRYVGAKFPLQWSRITAAFPTAELPVVRRVASAILNACAEAPLLVPGDVVDFVRSIIPLDDASIRFSEPIRGVTSDPERTLATLYQQFVGHSQPSQPERTRRDDDAVWVAFAKSLSSARLMTHVQPFTIAVPHLAFEFDRAWKNGTWHVVQPISFDLNDPLSMSQKSQMWLGRLYALRPAEHEAHVSMLVGLPPTGVDGLVRCAALDALKLLRENIEPSGATIYTEDEGHDLEQHLVKALHSGPS